MSGVALQASARYPVAIGTLTLLWRNQSQEEKEDPKWRFSKLSRENLGIKRPRAVDNDNYPIPPPPEDWPQRPLWVRATPGSSTRILRIRHVHNNTQQQQQPNDDGSIPFNNGQEAPGESTLIDFESDHFVGTLLLLIKGAPSQPNTSPSNDDYFEGRTQTWHGVVRGRFKQPQELQSCVTGQVFRRPSPNLLPSWIMQRLVMPLINRLAPLNAMDIECQQPYYWAPLAHLAQTVAVFDGDKEKRFSSLEEMLQELERVEPHGSDPRSIVHEIVPMVMDQEEENEAASAKRDLIKRLTKRLTKRTPLQLPPLESVDAKANRKARQQYLQHYFDQQPKKSKPCYFSPDKTYAFGLYNKWVVFHDPTKGKAIALDLGLPFLHHLELPSRVDGQPLVIMGAVLPPSSEQVDDNGHKANRLQYLWSFEVWHESLYADAKRHHDEEENEGR